MLKCGGQKNRLNNLLRLPSIIAYYGKGCQAFKPRLIKRSYLGPSGETTIISAGPRPWRIEGSFHAASDRVE